MTGQPCPHCHRTHHTPPLNATCPLHALTRHGIPTTTALKALQTLAWQLNTATAFAHPQDQPALATVRDWLNTPNQP